MGEVVDERARVRERERLERCTLELGTSYQKRLLSISNKLSGVSSAVLAARHFSTSGRAMLLLEPCAAHMEPQFGSYSCETDCC